jgi:hypothetical protein
MRNCQEWWNITAGSRKPSKRTHQLLFGEVNVELLCCLARLNEHLGFQGTRSSKDPAGPALRSIES